MQKCQYVLAKEFFKAFPENELGTSWRDCDINITVNDILQYTGSDELFLLGYHRNFGSFHKAPTEHIQRIRSLMQLSPLLWKPISLDMDWNNSKEVFVDDGHHRAYAASILHLTVIPVEWSGLKEPYEKMFPKSFQLGFMF